jgi:hypothetical protein
MPIPPSLSYAEIDDPVSRKLGQAFRLALARAATIPAYTTLSKTGHRLLSNWFAAVLWIGEQCADGQLDLIHSGKDGSELVGSEAEVKKLSPPALRCLGRLATGGK